MKLNLAPLTSRARTVTTIAVSSRMEVVVLDDVVDARTGAPTEVSADRLRGCSTWEAALYLHENYAGDTAFIVRTPGAFAVVRAAFSEVPIYYWQRGDTLEIWSGLEAPALLVERGPQFDLEYLAGKLLNWSWMTPATGLHGVAELLSGAVLFSDGKVVRQHDLLASAVRRLEADVRTPYAVQVEAFRQLISSSIRHKAGPRPDQVSVLCSGGVDSSVVAVAAAALHPDRKLPLIHCYSVDHVNGDERFYFDTVVSKVGGIGATVDMNA
ncbi:hypothetical protein EOD14_34315, partial [Mesorhizobium sp. M7A.T.Ca.US.000.02.1.1]|uniref:asparagine synthase-related protein n=2 Tax=unclassified Mesorhizobium TaxID=325217 RepID=UPI000FD2C22A